MFAICPSSRSVTPKGWLRSVLIRHSSGSHMANASLQAKPALPTTLAWYRDAANWVVGLSTGALAAGLAYRDEIQLAERTPRVVFSLSALAFLVAVVAGIQFYFWITTYGNQLERSHRVQLQLERATGA